MINAILIPLIINLHSHLSGADPGGGGRTRRAPPLKLEKNMIFWRKIVIFHTKYPKNLNFARPPKIGKNMIFWRKIVIFHTKYPKKFAPLSARRKLFNCAPPP